MQVALRQVSGGLSSSSASTVSHGLSAGPVCTGSTGSAGAVLGWWRCTRGTWRAFVLLRSFSIRDCVVISSETRLRSSLAQPGPPTVRSRCGYAVRCSPSSSSSSSDHAGCTAEAGCWSPVSGSCSAALTAASKSASSLVHAAEYSCLCSSSAMMSSTTCIMHSRSGFIHSEGFLQVSLAESGDEDVLVGKHHSWFAWPL